MVGSCDTGLYMCCVQSEVLKVLPPAETPPPSTVSLDTVDIESIELNLSTNRTSHHTDSYDHRGLVVRRGQKFNVTLNSKDALGGGTTFWYYNLATVYNVE